MLVFIELLEKCGYFVWFSLFLEGVFFSVVVMLNVVELFGIKFGEKFYVMFKVSVLRVIK